MSYGVTDEGFVSKTLVEIQAELDTLLKSTFGSYINTLPQSIFGQIKAILSEREYLLWEALEDAYNSQYPETASSVSLDDACSITGLSRLTADYSTVSIALFGTEGTEIPLGTEFSKYNDANTIFETAEAVTLAAGVDAIQTMVAAQEPTNGVFSFVFGSETTDSISSDATPAAMSAALNALDGLSEVSIAGTWADDFLITFAGDDGKQPQDLLTLSGSTLANELGSITPTISTTTTGVYQGVASCRATTTGEKPGAINTITEIDTPVSGLTSVKNVVAVTGGRDEETDAEFRIRRNLRVNISEAGTLEAIRTAILALNDDTTLAQLESVLGFENNTNSVDSRGVPAKSFELVVYEEDGGSTRDEEIAQAIWESKPAGILAYGSDVSIAVTDTQGFEHNISFSKPTEVDIYLELDLTTDSDYPDNGDEELKDLIETWGNALGVGKDVIVYPSLISQLNSIQGITDVVVRIGTAVSPTLDDNITIDDGTVSQVEISRWSTSRITISS